MRKHFARPCVALLTFVVGVFAAGARPGRPEQLIVDRPAPQTWALTRGFNPIFFGPTGCNFTIPETREERAVRLAEEFVTGHGYDFALERKAYGIRYSDEAGGKGYTVAFKRARCCLCDRNAEGVAVVLDENAQNPRLGRAPFPLTNVHRKF